MDDSDQDADTPEVWCPHLIACHGVRYDALDADAGHTLERVIVHVRPSDGLGFPFRVARMFLFAQLAGAAGDYTLRVRLLRLDTADGEGVARAYRDSGPWRVAITGENYAEGIAIPLTDVWFPEPGDYEFQLWADGIDVPLARERVRARG